MLVEQLSKSVVDGSDNDDCVVVPGVVDDDFESTFVCVWLDDVAGVEGAGDSFVED